jgi:spore maturation protein CgeB
MRVVILGLTITSSWGNGHATTFRALVRELSARGHDVLFLERDQPWYADNRDLPRPPYGRIAVYRSLEALFDGFARAVREADLVVLGSYVPEGVAVGEWVTALARGVTAFYDIDTPVTLTKLLRGEHEYLSPALVPRFDLYLSFTGGPILDRIERLYGARHARALYCSCDPELHRPRALRPRWDLGYIGTYSPDRQPTLARLMLAPAAVRPRWRCVVAGPQYPAEIAWPRNVGRVEHLPPAAHTGFYAAQRFTLNVTRADMVAAGWSPSVRLFEAAACATPIISDDWPGLEAFFIPGREILVARGGDDVVRYVERLSEDQRRAVGERARARVLAGHTAAHRALELEAHVREARARRLPRPRVARTAAAAGSTT